MEIWKEITIRPDYEVSNLGNIRRKLGKKYSKKIGKDYSQINGSDAGRYIQIKIMKNNIRKHYALHRLVAECFVNNEHNKPFVNHKDGNTYNNRADNLEWVTQKENIEHAIKIIKTHSGGKDWIGENNPNYKHGKYIR